MRLVVASSSLTSLVDGIIARGSRIGRFTITGKLGEGAFAVVLEGQYGEAGRHKVAIKVPKNSEAIKNIQDRKLVLSALGECPYTPNLLDEGDIEGVPYVVEEYREKSLATVFADLSPKVNRPSVDDIIKLAEGLLIGIDYFHRLSETDPAAAAKLGNVLTHTDIKPANILIHNDPRTREIVYQYTDFGIISQDKPEDGTTLQKSFVSGASIASVRTSSLGQRGQLEMYVAPEVQKALILGQALPITPLQDLWSIGAVLFKYATGKAPEIGITDPRLVRKDLDDQLTEFFKQILNVNEMDRYQSAQEALQGLERAANWCDSYIVGLTKVIFGEYTLFMQPMRDGKPVSKVTEIFLGGVNREIAMSEVPGENKTIIVEKSNDPGPVITSYVVSSDSCRRKIYEIALPQIESTARSQKQRFTIALYKNHKTDEVCPILTFNRNYRREGRGLRKPWEYEWHDETFSWVFDPHTLAFGEVKLGSASPWKASSSSRVSPNERQVLAVKNGRVQVYSNNFLVRCLELNSPVAVLPQVAVINAYWKSACES